MLADGDGEADLRLATDGDDGVGVKAAVGPHGEWSGGSSMAHPTHRLPQKVSRAPSGVGSTLAQSCHQHIAGTSGDGEERVIAPLAGVVAAPRPPFANP